MNGEKQDRRNWTLSLTLAVVTAVAAVVIGSMHGDESVATERFYLPNSAGPVLFDHGKHAEVVDTCATCHHTLFDSVQSISCQKCHDEGIQPSDFDHGELTEFHGSDCSSCHEQVADDDQAESCRGCHPGVQENEAEMVGCAQCHDEGYEPDMMEHHEYGEIEDHSCLGCHNASSVSEAYHASCTKCHIEEAPVRFVNADETVKCGGCHLL